MVGVELQDLLLIPSLAHGRMRVTEHDVYMMLGLPKGSFDVVSIKTKAMRVLSL